MALSSLMKSSPAFLLLPLLLAGCENFLKYSPEHTSPIKRVRNRSSSSIKQIEHLMISEERIQDVWTSWLESFTSKKDSQLYAPRTIFTLIDGENRMRLDSLTWREREQPRLLTALLNEHPSPSSSTSKAFQIRKQEIARSSTNVITTAELIREVTSANEPSLAQVTLVLNQDKGGLNIVKEVWRLENDETEYQQRLENSQTPDDPEEFSFIAESKQGLALLLGPVGEEDISGENPIYLSDDQAQHSVNEALLDKHTLALKDKIFRIYNREGLACVGRVDGFVALARIQPHFSLTEAWKGTTLKNYVPPARRAIDLWQLSKMGGRSLAATLKTEGDCTGAWWAQDSDWPTPKIWTQRSASAKELKILTEYIRVTPAYRQLQRNFQKHYVSSAYWDEADQGQRQIRIFENDQGRQFASINLQAGIDDSCSSPFDPDLWLLFERKTERYYQLVSSSMSEQAFSLWPRFLRPVQPEAAFDLNGDGLPEFVGSYDFFRSYGDGYQSVLNLSPAYFGSPC